MSPTSAVDALGDHAIILKTGICKTCKVFIGRGCPTLSQVFAARFGAEEELDDIGAVQFALEVDESVVLKPFLLLFLQTVSWLYGVRVDLEYSQGRLSRH